MTKRPASSTLDLFRDYEPKAVVARFAPADVAAWSAAGRLAKAVSITLNESGKSRAEIAVAMTEILKDDVSKSTLDGYASQANEERTIPALRLAALVQATGDVRVLNTLLSDLGLIVVPKKYEALMRREAARELRARVEREEQAADAEWRAQL